jgi:hypothetical protein
MIDDRKGYFLGDGFLEEKFAQINHQASRHLPLACFPTSASHLEPLSKMGCAEDLYHLFVSLSSLYLSG